MRSNVPDEESSRRFSLAGKVALVTGAGRGLGREIAGAFAASGATVIANMRTAPEGARDMPTGIRPLVFDIGDEPAVEQAFATIRHDLGGIDIVVNNVGQRDRRGMMAFSLTDVRDLLEVNLIAPFNIARQAARMMIDQGCGGRIINIGSIASARGVAEDSVYTIAKGGLEALGRAMAVELAPHRITVNTLSPGPFETETNAALAQSDAFAAWLDQRSPMRRWGQPAEISGAAIFLASDAASFVTGHTLVVDGGVQMHL